MNTMFNLAETCLLSQILDLYENLPGAEVTRTGVTVSGKTMAFEDIFKVGDRRTTFFNFNTVLICSGYQSSYRRYSRDIFEA